MSHCRISGAIHLRGTRLDGQLRYPLHRNRARGLIIVIGLLRGVLLGWLARPETAVASGADKACCRCSGCI